MSARTPETTLILTVGIVLAVLTATAIGILIADSFTSPTATLDRAVRAR